MTRQRVIQFEYQQYLVQDSDRPGWSEEVQVSVRLLSEALTSGWYRDLFANRGNDFVILLGIVMHARPLRGVDLALLVRLGMAQRQDEGRLYARVSDVALSYELGMNRMTIAHATERLAQQGSITILEVPDDLTAFRDSYGQFNGSKVYLLAGDLQNRIFEKETQPSSRAIKYSTVNSNGAIGYSTDPSHRANPYSSPAKTFSTNKDEEELEEVVNVNAAPNLARLALAYFAQSRGIAHFQPSVKEQHAALKLAQDGFSLEQIQAGIDLAFERTPPPRHFTHCAAVARDLARLETGQPEARSPVTRRLPAEAGQPETGQPETRQEEPEISLPAELGRAVQIFSSTGRDLSDDVRLRLLLMAESCALAAQKAGSSGGAWLADALTLALGRARPENLLGYADKVLGGWVLNGRSEHARRRVEEPDVLPPELAIFEQVTGRLPLRDQRALVTRLISQNGYTVEQLRPFWDAWVGRDRKRSDLGWLDWAARGGIPAQGAARQTGLDISAETLRRMQARFSKENDDGDQE